MTQKSHHQSNDSYSSTVLNEKEKQGNQWPNKALVIIYMHIITHKIVYWGSYLFCRRTKSTSKREEKKLGGGNHWTVIPLDRLTTLDQLK